MKRWSELNGQTRLEYIIRMVRWPFSAIAAIIFLAKNIDSLINSPYALWSFVAIGVIWVFGGAYVDIRGAMVLLDSKKDKVFVRKVPKEIVIEVMSAAVALIFIPIISTEMWFTSVLWVKITSGIVLVVVAVLLFIRALYVANKLENA